MKTPVAVLYSIVFEVRYSQGYVYLDRCGQTINDIENDLQGWVVTDSPSPNEARLERISKEFTVIFNVDRFSFTAIRASATHPDQSCEDAQALWKIVKGNLGLTSFYRLGCRLNYTFPTNSWDDAKNSTASAKLGTPVLQPLLDNDFKLALTHNTSVFIKDEKEYRVEISPVSRASGVDPRKLITSEPRSLSKGQREARIEYQKKISEFSQNPMFGVQLDVDCVWFEPDEVDVKKYMIECTEFVENNFLPLVEQTWTK